MLSPKRGNTPSCLRRLVGLFSLCALLVALPASQATAQQTIPSYREYDGSFFLPFGPRSGFESELTVRVRINGGPITRLQLDTGSTGVVLGQELVRSVDKSGQPDEFVYSSSGQVHHGYWNDVRIEFIDGHGLGPMRGMASVVTIPALIITNITCRPAIFPNACHAGPVKKRPAMLGIGLGSIARNALLNFAPMNNGQMRRGFIIEPRGVRVGLTATDVPPGFSFVKLEQPAHPDAWRLWTLPTSDIRVTLADGTHYEGRGRTLMDTGIGGMFLALPGAPTSGLIEPGAAVSVTPAWIGGRGPQMSFRLDDGRRDTPSARAARWVKMGKDPGTSHPIPFVNTGLHPLAPYRYLYDADGGYWGLMAEQPRR